MAAKYLPEDDKYLKMFGLTKTDLNLAQEEISLYGTSLAHNPEQRKADEMQFYTTFMSNPVVQQDIETIRQITADAMETFGKDSDKLLPTVDQLFAKQVSIQKQAIIELQNDIKKKKQEMEFVNNLTDLGLSPDRAQARLKQWKLIEESGGSPVTDETKEELSTSVPM